MGSRFDYGVRILLLVIATINLVIAVYLLNLRTSIHMDDDIPKHLATWQEYHVLAGILIIHYFDALIVWWG